MRVNGLINFVVLTSATACLMGVVTKSNKTDVSNTNPAYTYILTEKSKPTSNTELSEAKDNLETKNTALSSTFSEDEMEAEMNQLKNKIRIEKNIALIDTPDTDLQYNFNDNNGKPPQFDPKSKLYLENPSNVKTETEYNPKTGQYDVKQKIGDMDYRPETYMSMKEYQNYMFKKNMREYWRSRVAADDLNNKPRKGMIPKMQVNSELFDRIFGGNTVDIKPTGTAELIFGLNRNKNLNPAIPQRQQKITNFDFNMRIQLNLIGKIGDKLKISTNYNTEASFDWENQVKLDYTGYEDEILKKIEAGNVTLPLNSSLISGSQTLFGVKTQLQFGRLMMTTVFTQQRGKKQEVTVQGGSQTQQFIVNGDAYEQNRHYFLGHYFRDNYDKWMGTLPVINTPVVITKVEVYILGVNGNAEQTRNIVAFEDLGEDIKDVWPGLAATSGGTLISPSSYAITDTSPADSIPYNDANNLYALMTNTNSGILKDRMLIDVQKLASNIPASNLNNDGGKYMDPSRDYNTIQIARKLNPTEYFFNPRTGFISLNQQLNNEQALAVSYQYTYNGKIYQVGEFSDQIPDNSKLLICKLLKTVSVSVKHPMWDLMMKNVYSLGAYNLNADAFRLDVFYNNIETGVDVPYLPFGAINGKQLINVLNCDKLSANGDRFPDGVFDFIKDYTILPNNGRIFLPTVEPFGRSLENKFAAGDFPEANKYIFKELYDSTKTAATFIQNKNRFKIKGSYKSASGSEISLNALNIPQGGVVVTANGVPLIENSDYTVDYTLGRVKIINEGILNSGAQVVVSLESNSLFNVQQKSLWGARFDYNAGRNLKLGGTFLRFNERPITQKVSIGDEPVSNIVAGIDFNYKTETPFLTRLLDKLPFYSTKEMSNISVRGEYARLFPGNAAAIRQNGGNSYIDDFEGSISLIDVKNPNGWFMASIPQLQSKLFPEANGSNTISVGNNRARFNWYTVDPMFTRQQTNTTPSYYKNNIFSNNMWRQVFETELFPGKTPPNGQQVILPVLDLGFYPTERGLYNYDVFPTTVSSGIEANGLLKTPSSRWGGIMRRLETNDFQAANVEYIQFWMMDPYNEDYDVATHPDFDKAKKPIGDLYINLGNISEDIIKDGRMVYENGLPGLSTFSKDLPIDSNNIVNVPLIPPTVNAFSQDPADRPFQDVGYDGLTDAGEKFRFRNALADINSGGFAGSEVEAFKNDPSSDNYHFFRGDDYDGAEEKTLARYAKYNNPSGNSPTEEQYRDLNSGGYSTAATNLPNIEDVNRDNTLSETENYYQYHIKISPNDVNVASVGTNYLVDAFDGTADFSGTSKTVKWYQFKIPISQFESAVGNIEGFNSIRFMRVYMKGFDRPVLLRLARFELVRSDWRRYDFDLRQPGEYIAVDKNAASFDVSAVNLQENSTKVPVNYVLPPDIQQQQNVQTTNLVLQNEQALQMRVCNLEDGDSRAIFKNVELDTRMFNNIKMNVHAEKLNNIPLNDGDLTLFFRVGSDYNNNFYEYEVPLKLTPKGNYDPNSTDSRYQVWPAENEINFKFDKDITFIKDKRNKEFGYFSSSNQITKPFTVAMGGYSVTVVGNPNLGNIKSVMVGIRNPKGTDNLAHCAEVWINELRLTDFNNKGGWATTGQLQAKLADLGQVSLAGTYSTPFWGSVDKKINERSKETSLNWDMSASLNMGKFFPNKWKVTLPFFYNFGQTIIDPLFNPLDPDVRSTALQNNPEISDALKKDIKSQTQDHTERKGFNITNMRIDGLKRKNAKPMPWDIKNFSATYAYTEINKRSVNVEYATTRQYRGNLQYAFNLQTPPILKPFSKIKLFDNKWFALIKDFNLQLLPNSFGATIDLNRTYSDLKNRDITSFYGAASVFENPILYNKNFIIGRGYNLRWDLCRAIKFTYLANNDARILEPQGDVTKTNQTNRDSVLNTFLRGVDRNGKTIGKFGENTIYRQQMNVDVNVPINKIPVLDFMTVTYRYGGTYTWNRRPFAADDNIGNTIQNTNTHNYTANFNMIQFYNKIPYFKRINSGQNKATKLKTPKSLSTSTNITKGATKALTDSTNPKKNENFKDIAELLARGLMMIKNVSLTYQLQGGQALPNFKPNSQYLGMDFQDKQAPGFMFTTGWYDKAIRERSVSNDWLAKLPNQTTPYIETKAETFTYRSSVEPHGSLRIELNGNKTKSENLSEYMIYKQSSDSFDFQVSKNITGNFNISTFTFFRSLGDRGKGPESSLFSEFISERRNIAKELGDKNTNSAGQIDYINVLGKPANYIDGYDNNQQDVLLGAFYRTYTGRNIKNYSTKNVFPGIPLPNWTISWDGLGKIPIFKKTFRSITVRHGYRSTYNMSGFSNNLLYNNNTDEQNARQPITTTGAAGVALNPNFVPYYTINAITLTEAFAPLIKFDFQFNKQGWTANLETKRDKTTSLNITLPQIIETKGQEYIVGIGYLYPKLRLKRIQIQGKVLESNLIVKVDVSYRRNLSIIRRVDDTNPISTPTGGTNIVSLRSSADYQLTPNINLRLFCDWIRTKPQTSASFPTSNVTGGFSLRINFQ